MPTSRRFPAVCLTAALLVACNGDDPVSPESRVREITIPGVAAQDTLVVGDTLTLHPVLQDGAGDTVRNARVTWSASSPALSVDSTGKLTANGVGWATVWFESGQARDSVRFAVVQLSLGGSTSGLLVGDTTRLQPVLATPGGQPVVPVHWSSTDTMAVRVDSTGLVTGSGFGNAAVVATWTGPHGIAADTQPVSVSLYKVPLPVPVVSVTAGRSHACALTADGQAWCWGADRIPKLVVPTSDSRLLTDPTLVATDQRFVRISAGYAGTCGWTAEGQIYCWGQNALQAMNPALPSGAWFDTPTPVATDLRFPNGGLYSERGQTCGLTAAHEAYCWGYNAWGTLGHATAKPSTDPRIDTSFTQVDGAHQFTALASDGETMCGADVEGAAWCWGTLGSSLSDVPSGERVGRVRGSQAFRSLAVSYLGTACGVTVGFEGYCWGTNDLGQLGNGTRDATIGYHRDPSPVAGGNHWKEIAGGWWFCGITTEGKLFCWGGQAGFRGLDATRPQPVARSLSFRSVSASFFGSIADTRELAGWACAVSTVGDVYCFPGPAQW